MEWDTWCWVWPSASNDAKPRFDCLESFIYAQIESSTVGARCGVPQGAVATESSMLKIHSEWKAPIAPHFRSTTGLTRRVYVPSHHGRCCIRVRVRVIVTAIAVACISFIASSSTGFRQLPLSLMSSCAAAASESSVAPPVAVESS